MENSMTQLRNTECHLPYGITQCYLLPDTSDKYKYTTDQELYTKLLADSWRTLLHMQWRADAAGAGGTLLVYSADSSTLLAWNDVMATILKVWKCDVKSKIRLRQSMRICLKNNPAKPFHPDPNWKKTLEPYVAFTCRAIVAATGRSGDDRPL